MILELALLAAGAIIAHRAATGPEARDLADRQAVLPPAPPRQRSPFDRVRVNLARLGPDVSYAVQALPDPVTAFEVLRRHMPEHFAAVLVRDALAAQGILHAYRAELEVVRSRFKHGPTGELVHMGHDCADKYEALYDASAWELENGRQRAAAAKALTRLKNEEERADFLSANPGLAEALDVEHPIIADIKARFVTYRELSPKQVELVMKIADEVRNPKPPPPEDVKVPGPLGKQEFRGTIVSAKVVEGDWGSSWKITVKVAVEGGCWLAWGTAPQALLDTVRAERDAHPHGVGESIPEMRDVLRGREVHLRATLEAGREDHFRFMKRPTLVKGKAA